MILKRLRLLGSITVCALLAACTAGSESTEAATDEGALSAAAVGDDVTALDALVTDINGYASPDAWILEHPRRFIDDLDDRFFDEPRCTKTNTIEGSLRGVTRDRDGARAIRKLGITYSSEEGDVTVTTHETYHYDEAGHLRVVVLDREEDHLLDDAFMAEVTAHNLRVRAEHDAMPMESEADKVALANKMFELRTSETIAQHRLYFRANGELFAETKRTGLEHAHTIDFDGIDQTPPSLYGGVHPANVTGTPYLTRLFPHPDYAFKPLPTTTVAKADSMQPRLLAAKPFDPEASLASKPVCR